MVAQNPELRADNFFSYFLDENMEVTKISELEDGINNILRIEISKFTEEQ